MNTPEDLIKSPSVSSNPCVDVWEPLESRKPCITCITEGPFKAPLCWKPSAFLLNTLEITLKIIIRLRKYHPLWLGTPGNRGIFSLRGACRRPYE